MPNARLRIRACVCARFHLGFTETASASLGPFCGSAPCYRRTEDVTVVPVVVSPLKLGHVERQILGTDLVECTHDPALNQGPEAVDSLRVDSADHVFAPAVLHPSVRVVFAQALVAGEFIGREQVNLSADRLTHEALDGASFCVADDARYDVAFALHGTDHDLLATGAGAGRPFIFVPVLVLAADVGLVGLHDAHELAELGVNQPGADAVAHVVGSLVGAEPHNALHFQSRHALLACQHHVDDPEPVAHPDIRILEDGSDQHGKPVATAWCALLALPVKRAVRDRINVLIAAAGAAHAHGPAPIAKVLLAGVIVWEEGLKFPDRHLLGELGFGHRSGPRV